MRYVAQSRGSRSGRRASASCATGRGGTGARKIVSTARALTIPAIETAAKAHRQPASPPSHPARGEPIVSPNVTPLKTTPEARAISAGGTTVPAAVSATVNIDAITNPATSRVPSTAGQELVKIGVAWTAEKASASPAKATAGRMRESSTPSVIPPMTCPTASAVISSAAWPSGRPSASAMAGSRGEIMNSLVTITKMTTGTTNSRRGTVGFSRVGAGFAEYIPSAKRFTPV